jgi:hypothetical protein
VTYLEYLIWTASHTAAALNEAIRMALEMDHEQSAIETLEHKLDIVATLAKYGNPNPVRVEPKP